VLVTRPREQAAPFAAALAEAGATPLLYPAIELAPPPSWQPLDDALARLPGYAWIIFTSPSAVGFALDRAAARGLAANAFGAVRVAAVGDQTAAALRSRGLNVDLVPDADQQRQEGLVAKLTEASRAPVATLSATARVTATGAGGLRILFPQTMGGRELLRDQMVAGGHTVDVVPVSQTLPCDLSDPPPPFDVATFASPSALRAFVDRRGREALAAARVAVIGPTTGEAAAAMGVRVDAMPATPSVAAFIQALVDLRRRSPDQP